jgi:hypothetical protein
MASKYKYIRRLTLAILTLTPNKKSLDPSTPFSLLIRRKTNGFHFRELTNFKFPEDNFKFPRQRNAHKIAKSR